MGPMDSALTRQSPRLKSATPGPSLGPPPPSTATLAPAPGSTSTGTSTIGTGTSAGGGGGSGGSTSNSSILTTAGAQRERRSKRPAPGPVTANQEGGAAVAAGRRKNAPKKKGKLNADEGRKQEEWMEEEIDPNEPRYCVCNNVSYGTMICCENAQCEGGEWFHLDCVRLKEPPGRREKWWCPKCDPGNGGSIGNNNGGNSKHQQQQHHHQNGGGGQKKR